MRKSVSLAGFITVAFVGSLLFTGCKKETANTFSAAEEENVALFSSQSEVESQFVFNEVFDNVMGVNGDLGFGGVGIFGRTSGNNQTAKMDSLPLCTTVSL